MPEVDPKTPGARGPSLRADERGVVPTGPAADMGDEDLPTDSGPLQARDMEEELPTTIEARSDLYIPTPGVASTPQRDAERGADSRERLLGPPSPGAPLDPDDLLLGPLPSAGETHDAHPRLSGARARFSGLRGASAGPAQRTERSRPVSSASTQRRTEPAALTGSSDGREAPLAGSVAAPETPETPDASDAPVYPPDVPPVAPHGGPGAARMAPPPVVGNLPSQSWGMYLAGALAVILVWAVLAVVFGWGQAEEPRAEAPAPPLRATADAEAIREAPSPELPAGGAARGSLPPDRAGASPAVGPGAGADAASTSGGAGGGAGGPAARPPARSDAPAVQGPRGQDAPPAPGTGIAEPPVAEVPETPDGYMGVPDF